MSNLLSLENFFVAVKRCEDAAFRDKFDQNQIRRLKEWTTYAIERKFEVPDDIEKRAKEILSDLKIEVLDNGEISSKDKLASYIFKEIFQLNIGSKIYNSKLLYAEIESFLNPNTTYNNFKLLAHIGLKAILEIERVNIDELNRLLSSQIAHIYLSLVSFGAALIYFNLFPHSVIITQLNTLFNQNCVTPLLSQMPSSMVGFFARYGQTGLEILKQTHMIPRFAWITQFLTLFLVGNPESLFSQICEEKYHFILYGIIMSWLVAGYGWSYFLALEALRSMSYIIPLVRSALTLTSECLDYFIQQIDILNKDSVERNWMRYFEA